MKTSMRLALIPVLALLALRPAGAQTFSNTTSIALPEIGTQLGPASPYPSIINVTGLTGDISNLTVTLFNFSHTFPADIDVLLVGPTGASAILMSDTGGDADIVGVNLTFVEGATPLPADAIVSGTFAPTNLGIEVDAFAPPAPVGPYGTSLSVFNGLSSNGAWSLYVIDDFAADMGQIAGGYALNFTTGTGNGSPGPTVPDGGSTLLFLGVTCAAIAMARRTFRA